jgi:hypothetical protein
MGIDGVSRNSLNGSTGPDLSNGAAQFAAMAAADPALSATAADMSQIYSSLDDMFDPMASGTQNQLLFDFDLQDFWSKVGPGEVSRGGAFSGA